MNSTDRLGRDRLRRELARRFEHGRDAGGIVERAIIDRILARLGVRLHAEMVEMAHQHDMLGGQRRVGALEQADHFGAGEILPLAVRLRPSASAPARSRAGRPGFGLGRLADRSRATWRRLRTAARPIRSTATAGAGGPAAPNRHCPPLSTQSISGRPPRATGSPRLRPVVARDFDEADRAGRRREPGPCCWLRWASTSLGRPFGVPPSATTIFPRTSRPR